MDDGDDAAANDTTPGAPRTATGAPRQARRLATFVVAAALAAAPWPAGADDAAPLWQRLLRWAGGESSATPVATATTRHMQMSVRTPLRAGDEERAAAVVAAARRVVAHYRDVAVAERDGYRAFAPTGVVGEEVHYTNSWKAAREKKALDLQRPGSILYKRTDAGLVAVGVMYTASADATPEQLDARLPLSVAVWHRHVHFCGWPNGTPRSEWDGPGARFGVAGSIDSEAACRAAGGYWIPLVLGWMTHVYPLESEPDRIWLGEHAMHMAVPADADAGREHAALPNPGHEHQHDHQHDHEHEHEHEHERPQPQPHGPQ